MKVMQGGLVDGSSALSLREQQEEEFLKDQWDVRNIPGLQYAQHRSSYYILFTGVPEPFRAIVKDYVNVSSG